jgi:hypothetical protein
MVIVLLFTLLHRHSTINIVVSYGRFVGGSAKAGDTLTFSTSQASDPGYTVEFTGTSPCADNANNLPVRWGNPASCPLVASNGAQVSYVYMIKRNNPQRNNPPPGGRPHSDTVMPCKLCFFNSGSVGDGSREGQAHPGTQPSDNTLIPIGCSVNHGAPGVPSNPAEVTNDGSATVAWQSADTNGIWTVTPRDPNPCTPKSFSSNAPAACSINPTALPNSPNAPPESYTYDWTLTCNNQQVNGTGTVILDAPQ